MHVAEYARVSLCVIALAAAWPASAQGGYAQYARQCVANGGTPRPAGAGNPTATCSFERRTPPRSNSNAARPAPSEPSSPAPSAPAPPPVTAETIQNRGINAYHAGRYDDAVRWLAQAQRMDPSDANIADWLRVARSAAAQGATTEQALATLRENMNSPPASSTSSELSFMTSPVSEPALDFSRTPNAPPAQPALPASDEERSGIVELMIEHGRTLGWSEDEVGRLRATMYSLALANERVVSDADRIAAWDAVRARRTDSALIAAAAQGAGPGLYSSGWQRGTFSDCAVFAVATAAGLPYGVVAARANELIRAAPWRQIIGNDPARVYAGGGLAGGEIILLAESFGRAETVAPERFAATLREGRSITIGVRNAAGGLHQVALSRTFQRGGETWFELINSGQQENGQRSFIREAELANVIIENGVAYRADEGVTPRLLR